MPVADTRPFGWRRPHPRHLASAPCLASLARGDRSDRGHALLKFRPPPDLSAAQTPGPIEYGAKANVTKESDGTAHAGIHKGWPPIDVEAPSDPLRRNLIRSRQRLTSPKRGKRERNRTACPPTASSGGRLDPRSSGATASAWHAGISSSPASRLRCADHGCWMEPFTSGRGCRPSRRQSSLLSANAPRTRSGRTAERL